MAIYTTISGDTFDMIAYRIYEDENQAIHLMKANIELSHIVIFEAGIELIVPEVDTTPVANLPPWKVGIS